MEESFKPTQELPTRISTTGNIFIVKKCTSALLLFLKYINESSVSILRVKFLWKTNRYFFVLNTYVSQYKLNSDLEKNI